MKKKKILITLLSVILILFFVRLYIDHNVIEISFLEITSNEISSSFDGYKILHISDLHSKEFGDKLVNKIDEVSPDVIFMTGDMIKASKTDYTAFFNLVNKISPKYETYYIVGNHEQDLSIENMNKIIKHLEEKDVKILDNESVELISGNDTLNLYGLNYDNKYYIGDGELSKEKIDNFIGEVDKTKYNILLAHNPRHFEAYADWGADLTLSGHVHGGMVRLPFIGAVFSPDRFLFPEYSKGLYEIEDSKLIVSRGLGKSRRI